MRGDLAAIDLPPGFIQDVAAACDANGVLQAAARWLPRIIAGERSSVSLPVGDTALSIHAIGGSIVLNQGTELPIETSLVGKAFRSQQVVVVDDLELTDYAESEVLRSGGLRSAIVAPLVSGGRTLGTLNIGNSAIGWFTDDDKVRLSSIASLIASFMNVHDLAERERRRASTDDLTGVMARQAVLDEVAAAFLTDAEPPSLLFTDMDAFKSINDTYGHRAGDDVLRIVAHRIGAVLDDGDVLGRLGGDEFLILVRCDPHGCRAMAAASAIEASCGQPMTIGSGRINPRLSVGVAAPDGDVSNADQLLLDADQALYTAKRSGRAIAKADERTRADAALLAVIDRDVDRALDRDELEYHYQPIRSLETGAVLGAEALLRWNHPDRGFVPPPVVMERVEAGGRVGRFTEWSLHRVARDLAELRGSDPRLAGVTFSVNLSRHQLAWSGCADAFSAACGAYGLDTSDLVVEVVESSEIHTGDAAEATLRALANAGAAIALDDFGTGHNALGYFTRFPIHAIKFDRSLVRAMVTDSKPRQILRSLAAMSRELGIVTLAEGVETERESELAAAAGIPHGQGWHFGRPANLAAFIELARAELGESLNA